MNTKKRIKRENAKTMLEAQLKRGSKPEKVEGKTINNLIPLTEADKKRINKEIETLSTTKKK